MVFLIFFFLLKKHHKLTKGFYQDKNNEPLPWFTYPCIEFLKTINLKDKKILEFGSGSSTLFWENKAKSVISVEKDLEWYVNLKKKINNNSTKIYHFDSDKDYSNYPKNLTSKFDIIVIDGADRKNCLKNSINLLSNNGFIIFDNIEWYPNSAKFLRELEYYQIDFSGFSPLNSFETCTSIFFKQNDFLKNRIIQDHWHPIGGRYLDAYDD